MGLTVPEGAILFGSIIGILAYVLILIGINFALGYFKDKNRKEIELITDEHEENAV